MFKKIKYRVFAILQSVCGIIDHLKEHFLNLGCQFRADFSVQESVSSGFFSFVFERATYSSVAPQVKKNLRMIPVHASLPRSSS